MSIKIGDNNRIKNTTITENSSIQTTSEKSNWMQRHPVLSGIIATVIAGVILLLNFWKPVIDFINNLIGE